MQEAVLPVSLNMISTNCPNREKEEIKARKKKLKFKSFF